MADPNQGLIKTTTDLQPKVEPVMSACENAGGECFSAGTKLRTPSGYRLIEEFSVGDLILTRDEYNPGASCTKTLSQRNKPVLALTFIISVFLILRLVCAFGRERQRILRFSQPGAYW